MQPDVTVVIPVFNKEAYLRPCLESVLAQSHRAIEVICIDDASTDGSPGILQEFVNADSRVTVLSHQTNQGAAASRNAGIAAARGRYIRFVDADDLLPPNSTTTLYARAAETGAELTRGSIALFRGIATSKPVHTYHVADRAQTTLRDEPELWIPWWHTACLISTELIRGNAIGYPALRRGEDPVFLARVLTCARRISLLSEAVYLYRKYRKSSGSGGTDFEGLKDYLKHAAMVKAIYLAYHPDCWERGYGPFALEDIRRAVVATDLDAGDREFVRREVAKIWGPEHAGDKLRDRTQTEKWIRRLTSR